MESEHRNLVEVRERSSGTAVRAPFPAMAHPDSAAPERPVCKEEPCRVAKMGSRAMSRSRTRFERCNPLKIRDITGLEALRAEV